jgi:hypothetical protein
MIGAQSIEIETRRSLDDRLHRRGAWARDLAIVGAVSALPVFFIRFPWGDSAGSTSTLLLALFAAAFGALIGLAVPWLLHHRVRRKPLALLVPAAVGLGALWGTAATWMTAETLDMRLLWYAVSFNATVFAAQLGWFWLVYAIAIARRASGSWAVVAACALTPAIAWIAWLHVRG